MNQIGAIPHRDIVVTVADIHSIGASTSIDQIVAATSRDGVVAAP